MSCLGFKSVVFCGDVRLGELEAFPVKDQNFQFPNNEIRIHHIAPKSERCIPLSVLLTVSSCCCKLEQSSAVVQPHLLDLHYSCFQYWQTAVVLNGGEEVHLVAMPSKERRFPCFWCFSVPLGLYESCLGMLNLRCLSIVFDLDETLIVANSMKSFEDRIEALRVWIARETDPIRIQGMSAELKRCNDDRLLLKQYTDCDYIMDGGRIFNIELEEVTPPSDSHEKVVRPVIRLPEKNIVLTRINPEIRDTSVLVRLRPAWEDLRNYLTAKGRKRFNVYVCTLAEKDYALEMWRLLDPEAHLISSRQLLNRIVCVNSGSRKSLLNVFQDGTCHPKMAMVIDDRLKVWEEEDQPRVHVVPAFTPYYAPQAETATAVPVLCVARNVACSVRGCFFKEFDDNVIQRAYEVSYEDEVINLPATPDVSNYMMSEDAGFVPNGIGNTPFIEGISGVEVERRLSQLDEKDVMDLSINPLMNSPELGSEISQSPVAIIPNVVGPTSSTSLIPSQKPSVLGAAIRRDIRNHNSGQSPLLSREPAPISMQMQGRWIVEDDASKLHVNNQSNFSPCTPVSASSGLFLHASQVKAKQAIDGHDIQKQGVPLGSQSSEVGVPQNRASYDNRELQTDAEKLNIQPSHCSVGVLQEIGRRCSTKIEFRSVISTSKDLQFSVEVLFTGERIGVGMGKTRRDAQQQAAENALCSLAEKYMAYIAPQTGVMDQDFNKLSLGSENGFLWDIINSRSSEVLQEDVLPEEHTPDMRYFSEAHGN